MRFATTVCVSGRALIYPNTRMHFEDEDSRPGDEDPEFTGSATDADTDDGDDEFLSDDMPLEEDGDMHEGDDEEESDITADL